MIKVIKQNKHIYLTVVLILALIAVSIVSSNLFAILALAVAAVAVIFFRPSEVIVVLFALMPFANIFKFSPESMSLFTVIELFALLVFIFKCPKMKATAFVSVFALLAYIFLLSINNLQILTIIKVIAGFMLIYFATIYIKKDDVRNIAYLLTISIALMLLLCQLPGYFKYVENYLSDLNYYIDSSGQASEMLRNSGFLGDPNYCAVLIIVSLSLLCVLYYYKHIGAEFWVFSAILIPLGFLTYSKSYFLCIVMLVVLLILFVLFPKHKGWAIISLICVGVVLSLALSGKIEVFNMILLRFSGNFDFTTGRGILNQQYLSYIFENTKVLLLGEGICVDRYVGAHNNVHNIYIELFFKMGIIGSIIYLVTLAFVFNKMGTVKTQKRKFVEYMPALFVAVMFGFLGGVLNYATPFYMIIAYVALNYSSIPMCKEVEIRS